jgi:hypothetical protein
MSLEFVARHGIISLGNVQVTGSITASGGINISGSIASASFAESSSYATTSSYSISASYAQTASYVNPLNQNVQITGSLNTSADIQANKFVFTDGVVNTNNNGQYMFAAGGNYLYLYTGTNGLYINNQANTANNVIISDAGTVQTRGALTVGSPGNDQNFTFGGTNSSIYWGSGGPTRIYYNVGDIRFTTYGATDNLVLQSAGGALFNYGLTGSLLGNASTATTASYALTSSFATNFTASNILVTGGITAQTLNVQQVTSSVIYSSGSNIFGNSLSNTQQFTGSVSVTGSLSVYGNVNLGISPNDSIYFNGYSATSLIPANNGVQDLGGASNAWKNVYGTTFYGNLIGSASYATTASNAISASNSISSSFAISGSQSVSSSYALTASYALNGGSGGGVSAIYIADEGTLQGTASYFDFTGAGVTATVSAGTASINIPGGGGGSTSAGQTTTFTQSVAADPWTFTHNLNTRTPLVQVYDTSYNQITPQYISSSNPSTVIITFGYATAGYAVASMGGTLVVTGSNVILDQSVAATTWSFNHNLNTQYPVFEVYNTANEVVIPQKIVATDLTSSLIYFPTALAGKAVASVGGMTGSYTASFAISSSYSLSGSFAITASYALNGGGSGTTAVANQGTFIGTASYFDYVGNNISASVVNNTASITIIGATGTSALTQSVAAATWSFTHNLNTYTPLIQVYDSSYNQIIPNVIVGTTPNVAQIRFDYSQSGYAIASNGGTLTVSGSTAQLNQSVAATTWSFAHNLNSQYVNFEVYDSNNFVVIPANIQAVDRNNANLYFAAPSTGTAIAMFSGINGAPNATTASFAQTASYLNPVTNGYVVLTQVSQSLNFTDDTTAAAGGVPLGGLYRNGNFIAIRIS